MRHLLGIEDLSAAEATSILEDAEAHLAELRAGTPPSLALRGQTVINLFFEASTRTRTSFEIAAARLGAAVVNISPQTSSVTKGETLLDTVRTLDAMRPCALVVRHATSGAPHLIARNVAASVVNAGDGAHEHPTQALLDAFTILRKKPRLEGLVVAICGDLAHSRVARSNAILLAKLGARVRLAAPRTLLPPALGEVYGAEVFDRLEPALAGADVVMMLRVQLERLAGAALPSMGEYARTFGLNPARLALAKPDALVMHPGPMNRGVEIQGAVADGPQSVVLEQVESGVAVRAAVLSRLARAALARHSSSPGAENSSSSARSATSRSTSVPAKSPSSHRSTCSRSPAGSALARSRASTRSAAQSRPAARRTPRSSSPDSARPYDCSAARVSSRSPRTSGRSDFARTSGGPGSGKS